LKDGFMSYQRPNKLTQWSNRLTASLAARGLGPSKMVMLEVRGRRSGEPRVAAVNSVEVDGRRYLVSTRGESEWVRNARAANGEATIRHRGRRRVRLEEVASGDRAPVIKAYLQKTKVATRPFFGIDPDAPIEEFQRIAPQHPVFRIVDASVLQGA
jgi:deazaflavin-dependent oxidoreductase (nitroreductase family)